MDVDIQKIRELADLAKELDLAELKVVDGDKKVTIKTVVPGAVSAPMIYQTASEAPPPSPMSTEPSANNASPSESQNESHHTITSPMVGTFYRKPAPDVDAFTDVGQTISKGQTLCIIEAMKLMNELESDVSGTVIKFLVNDGEPVEFGQPLLLVDV